jgi:hypothetical protein
MARTWHKIKCVEGMKVKALSRRTMGDVAIASTHDLPKHIGRRCVANVVANQTSGVKGTDQRTGKGNREGT